MYKIVLPTGELHMVILMEARRAIWVARSESMWSYNKGSKVWLVRSELDMDKTIGYALNGEYFPNQYARVLERDR